jgi:hypothetical protein
MTKQGLFSGEVLSTFTLQDLIDMYKIGWRSLEGITLHPKHWATNEELERVAVHHAETLTRVKLTEIEAHETAIKAVTLSIVPPGEPSNEN